MKHIGLLLHFYQPPTQSPDIVRQIDEECYLPIFQVLREFGRGVTVNMNYSLTCQLAATAPKTLETIAGLKGCSFTASGAYHPIFPLIPRQETERQIDLNFAGNRELLGEVYLPAGVFPPEMALDHETALLLGSLGWKWTITDDMPWVYREKEAPSTWIPSVNGTGVFMRSNFWSNRISFHGADGSEMAEKLVHDLYQWTGKEDSYLVIAMDGETFGHHRPDAIECFLLPFLEEISFLENIRISTLDEILEAFPLREVELPAGSWSTSCDDLREGIPFPLWDHPSNINHAKYWELLNYVRENYGAPREPGVATFADKMLYSCPLWWASPGRISYGQVRRGILTILRAAVEGIPAGEVLDRVLELAGGIPAMAGKDR